VSAGSIPPQPQTRSAGDGASRLLMAVVGVIMAIGPCSAVVLVGGWAFGLVPIAALGVWLIALSAFYNRIDGPIRCLGMRMTVRGGDRP
jgi:Na+(H+)/acetate symporter ActP